MSFHLAGIIPVSGIESDFNMPWHDCMMPIGPNYLAIERAVVECANAGCETIWIVCKNDMQPLLKNRLGDYVQDPVWVVRRYEYNKREHQKIIPIFYVPLHPRDIKKRECVSWSILHGAHVATHISANMSKWLKPDKFYVSFPCGVYRPSPVRESRKLISNKEGFFFVNEKQTVKDGKFLGFTFNFEDYKISAEWMKKQTIKDNKPIKKFSLEESFQFLDFENSSFVEIENYWSIDNWENYCDYISTEGEKMKRPSKFVLVSKELNGIG